MPSVLPYTHVCIAMWRAEPTAPISKTGITQPREGKQVCLAQYIACKIQFRYYCWLHHCCCRMSLDMLNQQIKQLDHKINDLERRCKSAGDSDFRNRLRSFIEVHIHMLHTCASTWNEGPFFCRNPSRLWCNYPAHQKRRKRKRQKYLSTSARTLKKQHLKTYSWLWLFSSPILRTVCR